MANKAALHRLWMERNEGTPEFLDLLGIHDFPSWQQMVHEGQEVDAALRAGRIEWPPPELHDLHAVSRHQFGDPNTLAPEFRLLNPYQMFSLPSVRTTLEHATDRVMEMGGVRPTDRFVQLTAPMLFDLHGRMAWEQYGKQVYMIDPDTFDLLRRTDLPAMPSRHLEAPLQSFYLLFPRGAMRFVDDEGTAPQEIEGALVTFDATSGEDGYGRAMSVVLTGNSMVDGAPDGFLYAYTFFSPATPLSDVRFPSFESRIRSGASELVEDVPHVILGFCLYLMSEHPSLEPVAPAQKDVSAISNAGKRRKAEQWNARHSRYGYVYVGGGEGTAEQSSNSGSGRHLSRPSWVRGHWRQQAHGPGRKLRKTLWIKPHQRGPDLAAALDIRRQKVQTAREVRD